jgi:hypothetical protein
MDNFSRCPQSILLHLTPLYITSSHTISIHFTSLDLTLLHFISIDFMSPILTSLSLDLFAIAIMVI